MIIEIFIGVLAISISLYFYLTSRFGYWRRKGVPHFGGSIVLKILKDQMTGKGTHISVLMEKWYKDHKARGLRYFGHWHFFQPTLYILDLDICKHVLTKDFNHFVNRDMAPTTHEYITKHLFSLEGQDWKDMRTKLTPTFTSGKIKNMFTFMTKCAEQLQEHIENVVLEKENFEVKDLIGRFTTDIIATCAFGIEINSIEDPKNEFYETGKSVFSYTRGEIINVLTIIFFPKMSKLLNLTTFNPKATEMYTKLVRDSAEYRKKNNIIRNDFLDLLLKVSDKRFEEGNGVDDSNKLKTGEEPRHKSKAQLSIEEMTAQAFVFFFAGYETSASVTSFCMYELAKNRDIQERLQREVDEVLSRHGGEATYLALQEMTYMDQVMNETLRRYASLSLLTRVCTETYRIPETDLVIDKGVRMNIPTYAIHHDPEIYPDPYKFDPDRFSEENIKSRHHYAFLPFGEGPRNCIGLRFGKLQVKLGLTSILSRYHLSPAPDTPSILDINPYNPITTPKQPFSLRITRRDNM